ncbi:hypothetical protein FF1_018369 [Malus domestica]
MYEPDKEKTTFMIERGTYCYKVMPFGFKNTGATYQRLVYIMFKKQIWVTIEVYVDDIMVKGKQRSDHIGNLAKTFNILRKYKMKLNPAKCIFKVSSGRFLGYLVTQRGIKAYPKKIRVILEMKFPSILKEIQSLTGRAAALNRFFLWSTDRCKPFFKAIKRAQQDKWDDECGKSFQYLKKYLTSPSLLSKTEAADDLYIYLATLKVAVSYALMQKLVVVARGDEVGVGTWPILFSFSTLYDDKGPNLGRLYSGIHS